jgi:general secretion pathway protein L
MSVLAIQLPPRPRLGARLAPVPGDASLPAEWPFVLSADGRSVTQSGTAASALLPRADRVVLVLAEAEVSWHRIDIPRAPPARLRAALLGVMEEALLDDDEALHFALGPGAVPGQPGWIAVTQRPYLVAALAAIEASGLSVERVVAASAPGADWRGHFFSAFSPFSAEAGAEPAPWLALSGPDGACSLRLAGALARAMRPPEDAAVRWTSTPGAATAAERWLGAPVALMTEAERVLESAAAPGNLRQFDLAARHRGSRAVRDGWQQFFSREWRPVRVGVAALLVLQLVGLNAYAWKERQALAARRTAMAELLKASHPGVRAVLDAPLQMQRETERLRVAAGRPGEADLEAMLGVAAAAWPEGQGPVQTLRYETGRLTLSAPGFGEPQMAQFRERLRSAGFTAELVEGRVTVSRPAAAAKAAA